MKRRTQKWTEQEHKTGPAKPRVDIYVKFYSLRNIGNMVKMENRTSLIGNNQREHNIL